MFTKRLQNQLGVLLKGSKPQVQAEPQQERHDALPHQQQDKSKFNRHQSVHKLKLEFEGPQTSTVSNALCQNSPIKHHRRKRNQQRQCQRDHPAASPRSPASTHRQHIVDSLLSLAMASIKQPQPTLPLSTVVQGGPCGFRSPRRQVIDYLQIESFTTTHVTSNLQLSMDVGGRAASFASLSTAGNSIKLGFTTSTNTTNAVTQSALAAAEAVGQTQVRFSILQRNRLSTHVLTFVQNWLWPPLPLGDHPATPNFQQNSPALKTPGSPSKWSRASSQQDISPYQ